MKKFIIVFTLICYCAVSTSCYYYKKIENVDAYPKNEQGKSKITKVKTKSGKLYKFSSPNWGKFNDKGIFSESIDDSGNKAIINIPFSEIEFIKIRKLSTVATILTLGYLGALIIAIFTFDGIEINTENW